MSTVTKLILIDGMGSSLGTNIVHSYILCRGQCWTGNDIIPGAKAAIEILQVVLTKIDKESKEAMLMKQALAYIISSTLTSNLNMRNKNIKHMCVHTYVRMYVHVHTFLHVHTYMYV